MRRTIILLSALPVLALLAFRPAPAQPTGMNGTAPDKMTRPGDAEKMRACDEKAMSMKIPMQEKAAFVTKCMEAMN